MRRSFLARCAAVSAIACGLVATTTRAQNNVEYTYDDLGRVSTVCYMATADFATYQYDATGNRSTASLAANACGPTYLSIADASPVTEGGLIDFTINRTGNTSVAGAVTYASADGTATAASDYTALTPTVLSFAAGEASKTISIQTTSDTLFEMAETVFVNLSNPANGASITDGQAVGTINNDDALSGVNFLIADVSAAEGGVLTFTVTKSGPTSLTHDVDFATADGTGAATSDYTAASGTLSFAPADTSKTFTVSTMDDAVFEGNETVLVNLSNATNGAAIADSQGVGTINENEAAPTFVINNTSIAEGGTLIYTVTKTGSTALTHAVSYATANGSAVASDYTSKSGTLTFAPSDTSKTISVATTSDSVYELNETVLVNLSGSTNGAIIADAQGVGTINNDDPAPTFAINNVSAVAGNNLSFNITKTGSTALSHSVNYASANGTAVAGTHYNSRSGGLTFTSSQTSKTVSVSTISGSVTGSNKTMYLNLSNATNGSTIADSQGVGTITPPPNNPPVAVNDSVSGTWYVYNSAPVYVLNNDSDPDGDALSVISASCVSGGCIVSIKGGGSYITVTGTTSGSKTVNYTISDGRGGTDGGKATVSSFEADPCQFC